MSGTVYGENIHGIFYEITDFITKNVSKKTLNKYYTDKIFEQTQTTQFTNIIFNRSEDFYFIVVQIFLF